MSERDIINTAIAEAGSDPAGLAAVLYTVLNRSQRDGKTPSQVVKQRNQYEGYSSPGWASVKAQNDPQVRAIAEKVWAQVQSRAIPDPTGGGFDFRASHAAKGMKAPNGTVTIAGNTFARGSGSPQTALAAINDAVAPNPQSRPPALGYAQTPASVRAITVNPDGTPEMLSGLAAKFPGLNFTMSGKTDEAVTGMKRPPAMPVPRVASLPPSVPQSLVSHPVQTVRIDPLTNKVITPNSQPSLQDAVNAKAGRIASGQESFTSVPSVPRPANVAPPILKTTAQAGNIALPPGVVPKSVVRDMASISAMQANRSGSPDDRSSPRPTVPRMSYPSSSQLAAMNNVNGAYQQPITHTAIASQDRLPPLPPTAYVPTAPKPPAVAAIDAATVPLPRPRPVPTVPVPGVTRPQPLTRFLPPAQRQNDTLTTLGNHAGNFLAGTPAGHVYGLLTGAPNTGGGILDGLFGYGGLFNQGHTASAPPPVPTGPPVGTSFLNAQGVNTSGMTPGQVQNELMRSITGHQRGSFGPGN